MGTYREHVRWPLWFHALMAFPVVVAFAVIAGRLGRDPTLLAPAAVVLIVGTAWWRLRFLRIDAGPAEIAFGFGGLRRRVPREKIVSVKAETYRFFDHMGWGYRFGRRPRERSYAVIGHDSGLRIVFRDDRDKEWSIFLSCSDPEAAVDALST